MIVNNYNKDMILWGIERAGFQVDEFLQKNNSVKKWIDNIKYPTFKQLEQLAQKLYIPFGYFFLQSPPVEYISFPFFRSNNQNGNTKISLNVYDTIKILENRQDWLIDYLKENEFSKLEFVGKYSVDDDYMSVVDNIRNYLGLDEIWASNFNTNESAVNRITELIENLGIIVTFNGVVGNNTKRKISVEECRGFVMVDEMAPFMFINNSDAKSAQLFTIIHELAHIWIGQSAGFDFRDFKPANNPKELFCDKVAAEFLVPSKIFKEKWEERPNFNELSKYFKVSKVVIARRALTLGFIDWRVFNRFYDEYKKASLEISKNKTSGGDFYVIAKKRISPTFAAHVNNGVRTGKLLYRDAYRLTGIKGDTFSEFFTKIL